MTISHYSCQRSSSASKEKAPLRGSAEAPLLQTCCLKLLSSFSESGSDRFFGDFWLRYATICCAGGGTATAPLNMMSCAATFLP